MPINLTFVVNQLLTPDVIAQIASFLGIDRSVARKAAGATIPTLAKPAIDTLHAKLDALAKV